MKGIKWNKNAFPPLNLTAQQESKFRHLARDLVRETLAHADSFQKLPESERDLAKHTGWKRVKTRANLTVFKERHPPKIITGTCFDTPEHQRLIENKWKTPRLMMSVGSIGGSLDDVMYGVVMADAQDMMLKTAIMRYPLTDGAVLAQIDGPSSDVPFRFLGIKWLVRGPPAIFRGFVQLQDLVVIEATGVFTRSNGERIGYQVLHSVDLDGYDTLPGRCLMRGRISSCKIFIEKQSGRRVDVYVRGYVEQHGKLLNSVVLKTASTEFLSACNAAECSQVKKLQWFLENPQRVTWEQDAAMCSQGPVAGTPMLSHASTSYTESRSIFLHSSTAISLNDRCGGTCGRKMKKAGVCSLCHIAVCFKCHVSKTLISTTCDLKLERQERVICRSCVAKVRFEPVISIAKQEIDEGRYRCCLSNQSRQAPSVIAHAPWSAVPSPSCRYASADPTSESNFFMADPNATTHSNVDSSGSAVSAMVLQCLQQLEQQQGQVPNARLERSRSCWFGRHKKRKQVNDEWRPVLFEESTMLRECQSRTLSQCSTVADSMSTTSPINSISWPLSIQDSERYTAVDENNEDGWSITPAFTESKQERQQLWQQLTELQIAVENTYQIAKRTTASCCGLGFSSVGERTSEQI
ncbi:unnamed protein product [Peronospora belbahrii]|uniref:FYVE-type domain-containing protein n=1 Tax=Peronospora belbahrii TaxID=622444 RepID=A0AAU9KXQ3_9STRA|nr:unnamed protein product [Peronospora belbahrii]CAH0513266.1 unnamed protein product [Peronospora belbahrii]